MTASNWEIRNSFSLGWKLWVLSFVIVDSLLHFTSETSDQTLNWPSSRISKSADGVAFNLIRKLLKHVNFCKVSISDFHSFEHINHPASSFTAWSALTTTLVSVEFG